MNDDKVDRDYVRSLSNEQLKALLPERAEWFFKKHEPLLEVHRLRLLGELDRAHRLTQNYFANMPPDDQYMIVMEIAALAPVLASVVYSSKEIQRVKEMSARQQDTRFENYGINVHLTKNAVDYISQLLELQHAQVVTAQSALEDFLASEPENKKYAQQYEMVVQEHKLNHDVQGMLLSQLKRLYPSLVARGK